MDPRGREQRDLDEAVHAQLGPSMSPRAGTLAAPSWTRRRTPPPRQGSWRHTRRRAGRTGRAGRRPMGSRTRPRPRLPSCPSCCFCFSRHRHLGPGHPALMWRLCRQRLSGGGPQSRVLLPWLGMLVRATVAARGGGNGERWRRRGTRADGGRLEGGDRRPAVMCSRWPIGRKSTSCSLPMNPRPSLNCPRDPCRVELPGRSSLRASAPGRDWGSPH